MDPETTKGKVGSDSSRDLNFLKFWTGESISFVGSQITQFALPLVAVIGLDARPQQIGLLFAAEAAPVIVLGAFAGVWIDRLPRRPLLIVWDLASALVIASIPLAAALDLLSIGWLYFAGVLFGVLDAFGAAWHAFLPTIVPREDLTAANGKLEASSATASIVGPGLAGLLIQAFSASFALLADAASYLVSALFLSSLRTADLGARIAPRRSGIRREIREGLRATFIDPLQRAISGVLGMQVFVGAMVGALYAIYLIRHLGVSAGVLGIISATGGIGALAGSLGVVRLSKKASLGHAALLGGTLISLSPFLIVLAGGGETLGTRIVILLIAALMGGAGVAALWVVLSSLRQAITDAQLLGRVYASQRQFFALLVLIGSLVGGFLGGAIGPRAGIVAAAFGHVLIVIWIAASPIRVLRDYPGPNEEHAADPLRG